MAQKSGKLHDTDAAFCFFLYYYKNRQVILFTYLFVTNVYVKILGDKNIKVIAAKMSAMKAMGRELGDSCVKRIIS